MQCCTYLVSLRAVNDNEDLANLARTLLIRMCGVTPPRQLLSPLMDAVFEAIQKSPVCFVVPMFPWPSLTRVHKLWKVRLTALPVLQGASWRLDVDVTLLMTQSVLYFRLLPLVSEGKLLQILDVCVHFPCRNLLLIQNPGVVQVSRR